MNKIINNKVVQVVFNCGIISESQIKNYIEIDEHLLESIKNKLFESKVIKYKNKKEKIFFLSNKGIEKIISYNKSINASTTYYFNWAKLHEKNLQLADYYLELNPQEQASWINQQELAKATSSKILFDALYTNKAGELIGLKFIKNKTDDIQDILSELNQTLLDLNGDNMEFILY